MNPRFDTLLGVSRRVFVCVSLMNFVVIASAAEEPAVAAKQASLSAGATKVQTHFPTKAKEDAYRLNERGVELILQGKRDLGRGDLLRAHKLDPENSAVHFNLGGLFLSDGQAVSAVKHMERAAQLAPNDPAVLNRLAEAYFAAKQVDAALVTYEKLVSIAPGFRSALLHLGTLYGLKKSWQKAESTLRRAEEKEPKNPRVLTNLGNILVMQEKYLDAIPFLSRAYEIERTPDVAVALGIAHEESGNVSQALKHYREAKDLGSTDPLLGSRIDAVHKAIVESGREEAAE